MLTDAAAHDRDSTVTDSIDPALLAAIVREVIAEWREKKTDNQDDHQTDSGAVTIHQRVVTAEMIEQLSGTPKRIWLDPKAVVTPAARDLARQRGIAMDRTAQASPRSTVAEPATNQEPLRISDTDDPARAELVRTQLARRNGSFAAARIVLSDGPAREVHRQCSQCGQVAVMITAIDDVQRFAAECSPTVWVLDMKRLNLTSATNVVVRINQLTSQTRLR